MGQDLNPEQPGGPPGSAAEIGYDPELGFDHALLYEAYGLWRTLGGGSGLPALADLDPLNLPRKMLPHIQLVDIEPGAVGRLRWRLIGTHVTRALGRDSTGLYWDELYDPEILEVLRLGIDWVRERRQPIRCHGTSGFAHKDFQRFEAVEMPLSDDQRTVNAIWIVAIYG